MKKFAVPFNQTWPRLLTLGTLLALQAMPAIADDANDVTRLLQAGQHAQALAKADAFLRRNPNDAQMRFFKGLILGEQNQSEQAIAVYTKLTKDFPDLPEPYNNLAVLLTASGQYDKARTAFETATRLNPGYTVAYENLGDLYAKMAVRSYNKAARSGTAGSSAKLKMTTINSLIASSERENAQQIDISAPVAVGASASASTRIELATAPAKVMSDTGTAVNQVPPMIRPATNPAPMSPGSAVSAEILKTVDDWVKAWNARDVKAYLGFYGVEFKTPDGETRKTWEHKRGERLQRNGYINVSLSAPQVDLDGSSATASFRQTYQSNHFSEQSNKVLVLNKENGQWRIVQERVIH